MATSASIYGQPPQDPFHSANNALGMLYQYTQATKVRREQTLNNEVDRQVKELYKGDMAAFSRANPQLFKKWTQQNGLPSDPGQITASGQYILDKNQWVADGRQVPQGQGQPQIPGPTPGGMSPLQQGLPVRSNGVNPFQGMPPAMQGQRPGARPGPQVQSPTPQGRNMPQNLGWLGPEPDMQGLGDPGVMANAPGKTLLQMTGREIAQDLRNMQDPNAPELISEYDAQFQPTGPNPFTRVPDGFVPDPAAGMNESQATGLPLGSGMTLESGAKPPDSTIPQNVNAVALRNRLAEAQTELSNYENSMRQPWFAKIKESDKVRYSNKANSLRKEVGEIEKTLSSLGNVTPEKGAEIKSQHQQLGEAMRGKKADTGASGPVPRVAEKSVAPAPKPQVQVEQDLATDVQKVVTSEKLEPATLSSLKSNLVATGAVWKRNTLENKNDRSFRDDVLSNQQLTGNLFVDTQTMLAKNPDDPGRRLYEAALTDEVKDIRSVQMASAEVARLRAATDVLLDPDVKRWMKEKVDLENQRLRQDLALEGRKLDLMEKSQIWNALFAAIQLDFMERSSKAGANPEHIVAVGKAIDEAKNPQVKNALERVLDTMMGSLNYTPEQVKNLDKRFWNLFTPDTVPGYVPGGGSAQAARPQIGIPAFNAMYGSSPVGPGPGMIESLLQTPGGRADVTKTIDTYLNALGPRK